MTTPDRCMSCLTNRHDKCLRASMGDWWCQCPEHHDEDYSDWEAEGGYCPKNDTPKRKRNR